MSEYKKVIVPATPQATGNPVGS